MFREGSAREIDDLVECIVARAAKSGRKSGFFIGNTRKPGRGPSSLGPLRESQSVVAGSIVVSSVAEAVLVARIIDGKVDIVFVDSEKKIPKSNWGPNDAGNIELGVKEVLKQSKLLTYKANDMAAWAIDALVSSLAATREKGISGTEICILGFGNVGSKVALSLVERGANVRGYRRNIAELRRITDGINSIKPVETLSRVRAFKSPAEAAEGSDILIGLSPGVPVITSAIVRTLNLNGFVIDGGKGCVSLDAAELAAQMGLRVYRTDIQPVVAGTIETVLKFHGLVSDGLERVEYAGFHLVSAGLLAREGELVVDDAKNPHRLYGVADGFGELRRVHSDEQLRQLQRIADYFGMSLEEI